MSYGSTALGRWNKRDYSNTQLLIVGNGQHDTARRNAFVLETNGDAMFAGKLTLNGAVNAWSLKIGDTILDETTLKQLLELQERVANLTITQKGDKGDPGTCFTGDKGEEGEKGDKGEKGDSGHTFSNTTVASIQSLLQNINITTASERACLKARYRTLGTECPVVD